MASSPAAIANVQMSTWILTDAEAAAQSANQNCATSGSIATAIGMRCWSQVDQSHAPGDCSRSVTIAHSPSSRSAFWWVMAASSDSAKSHSSKTLSTEDSG